MKTFLVTKKQLNEYIDKKRSEKIFYDIVESIHKTNKFLNESISHKKVNQSIIDDYTQKNLITPRVHEMLVKYKIIDEKNKLL